MPGRNVDKRQDIFSAKLFPHVDCAQCPLVEPKVKLSILPSAFFGPSPAGRPTLPTMAVKYFSKSTTAVYPLYHHNRQQRHSNSTP